MKLRFCGSKVVDCQQFHILWKSEKWKCMLSFHSSDEQQLSSSKEGRKHLNLFRAPTLYLPSVPKCKGRCLGHILSAHRGPSCALSLTEHGDHPAAASFYGGSAGSPTSWSILDWVRGTVRHPGPCARVASPALCVATDTLWTSVNGPCDILIHNINQARIMSRKTALRSQGENRLPPQRRTFGADPSVKGQVKQNQAGGSG